MTRFLLLAFLALAAINAPSFCQETPKQAKPAARQGDSVASPTDTRGTNEYPLVVRINPIAETDEELAAETRAHEAKTSNERWLVILTGLLALFTAGLALFTWKLWTATAKLVKGAEETAQRQLRAYVCVDAATMAFGRLEAPEAEVAFRNCGQTPAYDVRQWIHMWIAAYPLTETLPSPPPNFRMAKSILPPRGHTIMVMPKDPPVPANAVKLLGTPQGTIYVYGEVRYRDIFGIERSTKYRLMYGGAEGVSGGAMKPCDEGNEAT